MNLVRTRKAAKTAAKSKARMPVLEEVFDLAWAGNHAKAIERATQALPGRLAAAERMDLLDLRSESFVALG